MCRFERDRDNNHGTPCSAVDELIAELGNEIVKGDGEQSTGRGDDDLFIQSTRER